MIWVDPFSGLSGDIWVGGFLALGAPEDGLRALLGKLPLPGLELRVESVMRCGIRATRASVCIGGQVDKGESPHLRLPAEHQHEHGHAHAHDHHDHHHGLDHGDHGHGDHGHGDHGHGDHGHGDHEHGHHGHDHPHHTHAHDHAHDHGHAHDHTPAPSHTHGATWAEVDALLRSHLPARVSELAREAFHRLALAEASVHGVELEHVHFHEVGTLDSIADVSLAAAGYVALGEPELHIGPVATGHGHWRMAHGHYPLPGPATLRLLEGFQLVPGCAPADRELATPTGAALAALLAAKPQAPERFIPEATVYAAGGWDFPETPNVCRFIRGRVPQAPEQLLQLETNLDDATPQQLAHAQARLLEAGALDAWVCPATFKKGRSGWVLGALLPAPLLEPLRALLSAELPTLGLRFWPLRRLEAERRFIPTGQGGYAVPVKEGLWPEGRTRQPEYDAAAEAARKLGLPLREVQRRALEDAEGQE